MSHRKQKRLRPDTALKVFFTHSIHHAARAARTRMLQPALFPVQVRTDRSFRNGSFNRIAGRTDTLRITELRLRTDILLRRPCLRRLRLLLAGPWPCLGCRLLRPHVCRRRFYLMMRGHYRPDVLRFWRSRSDIMRRRRRRCIVVVMQICAAGKGQCKRTC